MAESRDKSRSLRRSRVRLPAGKTVTHHYRRNPGKAQCAGCGDHLMGVVRAHSSEMRKMSLSKKRPERPYGGMLCSRCTRQTIVTKFRNIFSLSNK